ncbi:hypothetical protein BDV06DRAFT_222120 [Aspergillus oleicola]
MHMLNTKPRENLHKLCRHGALCPPWFEQPFEEKFNDSRNPAAVSHARFVPFGSEQVGSEAHLDETFEFQNDAYSSNPESASRGWSTPGKELLNASQHMHKECNRIVYTLLDSLSCAMNRNSLTSLHSEQNSFFAPYYYYFPEEDDNNKDTTLRVPPHIDPTTMLFCFQDAHFGLEIADLSKTSYKADLSTAAVTKTAMTPFIPVPCLPGEFVVLAGHLLRRLVPEMKHSVHRVQRPLGTKGYHLNFWIVPDLQLDVSSGGLRVGCEVDGGNRKGGGRRKQETVAAYLARVFPSSVPLLFRRRLETICTT